MWVSINGLYSACLLVGVTPTAELFLTSFSHHTQKDGVLYFLANQDIKGFYEPLPSKLGPECWRPFFFFVSGGGLPKNVPSSFTPHPKSARSLPGSTQYRADSMPFTAYWANTRPMPL
ncbi:hypothetical protein LIER_39877 [Lithospermum erythrorhizon]|uniref:Uncharacterized protein n=1 Tax=Lithospermum erythrorhizon TaxID=34254 RepID=A0AAV3QPI5_LITER